MNSYVMSFVSYELRTGFAVSFLPLRQLEHTKPKLAIWCRYGVLETRYVIEGKRYNRRKSSCDVVNNVRHRVI